MSGRNPRAGRNTRAAAVAALAGLALFAGAGCGDDGSGSSSAQVAPRPGEVEVRAVTGTGRGRVRGTPDTMTIELGVETRAPTAQEAMARNAEKAGQVNEALRCAGVAEDDIQTSNLSVNPVFNDTGETIRAYQVVNSVTATLHQLEQAGAVIDAAAAVAGDDIRVHGVNFSIEDTSDLVARARREAVERARAEADQLAAAAGLELGDVISVEQVGDEAPPPPIEVDASEDSGGGAASTPIEPGSQELTVDVVVRVEID